MEFDTDEIDEAVLALLHPTRRGNGRGATAWKSHDWEALNRPYETGYIGNPVNENESVARTEVGQVEAEVLFRKPFGTSR